MSNCEPVRLRLVCPGIKLAISGEISRHNAPNLHKKGLHLCWGMYKREKRTERASKRVLTLVRLLTHVYRPYSFAPGSITSDGKKLWESAS